MAQPSRRRLRFLIPAVLALLAPAAVRAQVGATTDIITGVVTDSAGHPLAEASVEALSLETQITRRQLTDPRGRFTIVFPDGGGQYQMTARMIGMAPHTSTVTRQADEDRLVWNVKLGTSIIELEAVTIRGARRPVRAPDLPTPGSTERVITPDNVARLPIDANDLTALVALVPGITTLAGTDSTAAAFSVAGQRAEPTTSRSTASFGSGSVPQDAVRSTRVITNTYDVARGQFSGGQMAHHAQRHQRRPGLVHLSLRDPAPVVDDAERVRAATRRTRSAAGLGGPIVKDKLFVFGSASGSRRAPTPAVAPRRQPADAERLGVARTP